MKKYQKRLIFLLGMIFSTIPGVNALAQTVQGTITTSEGEALPGVNILVKNSSTGTSADANGNYSISVSSLKDTLVFSFVGFQKKEIPIRGRSKIDVSLQSQTLVGEELVVTALGREQKEESLTYSTQNIEGQDLAKAQPLNITNSLSGRVAGISVNQSSTGLGGDSRVILRGNRSINGSSQPLYVVDGVPTQGNINGLNANNIKSINVLKGANAAALYGSDANNGVIVVTTKKGTAGEVNVSLSENFTKSDPIIMKNYQNVYGQGNNGSYSPVAEQNWGPEMNGQMVDYWSPAPSQADREYTFSPQADNVKDAFQSGYKSETNLSVSMGTDQTQYYFSYEYTDARGVVPNNQLSSNNVNLRVSSDISDKLSMDAKLNYIRREIDNELNIGEDFANPLRHMYRLPRNIRIADAENFEYVDDQGLKQQNYWNPGSNGGANPFWTMNRNLNNSLSERVLALASLTYDFTDELSLMVRSALDRRNGKGETKQYNNTYIIAPYGYYAKSQSDGYKWDSDFLLAYKNVINEKWSVDLDFGGDLKMERNNALSSNTGTALTAPNFFALSNTQKVISDEDIGTPRDVQSLYGFGTIGYQDAIYLDFSARNDWSSTLPAGNQSYFYPSVGLSFVLSDLLPSFPEWFTQAKLRSSYAAVGNDTSPFMTKRTANLLAGGRTGFLRLSNTIPNEDLVPERTKSLEIGANLAFFSNRLALDLTWYKTNTENQLFSVALPVGSGASSFFTNGGNVQNKGLEATLSVSPLSTNDLSWDIAANFSRNVSLVEAINDQRPSLTIASDFLREFRIEEGKPWGEVYARGFVRDDQGRVIVGDDGLPNVTSDRSVPVANYNPDWLGSITNSFRYNNFNFSFLIDIRKGGSVSSLTNAILFGDGQTKGTLIGRDESPGSDGSLVFGGNVFSDETAVKQTGTDANGEPVYAPNDITTDAETFWNAIGGRNNPVGEAFVSEASNVRMREITLGYTIPGSTLKGLPISNLQISLVARNLFFFYNAAENFDPDVLTGTDKTAPGFESFTLPNSRIYGLNVELNF